MEKKLSKRAQLALEVLKAGGQFVNRLERGYHGGEKFHRRLLRSGYWGSVVPGVGHAAFYELHDLDLLVRDFAASSSVSQVYKLKEA